MTGLRYLLDTNIISALVREPNSLVQGRLTRAVDNSVCTSVIVACELRYGSRKRRSDRLTTNLELVLGRIPILPFTDDVSFVYAHIRNVLEIAGSPIGPNDLLIAAHASSLGLILVTHNTREFERVPGLKIEDWLA